MTDKEADRAVAAYRAMSEAAMLYVPLPQRDVARNTMMAIALGVLHGTMGPKVPPI